MDETVSKVMDFISSVVKAMGKLLKLAFKLIAKVVGWVFSILASSWIVLLIIAIIVLVVAVVAFVIHSIFGCGYDSDAGTVSSTQGIEGDCFYGQRYIYLENDFTTNDLANVYLNFTYDILKEASTGAGAPTINIDFTKAHNDASNKNKIEAITTSFAVAISGKEAGEQLLAYTSDIDNYGFTNEQKELALQAMASHLDASNIWEVDDSDSIYARLSAIYDDANSNFNYMKNVCKKIIIRDYLCEGENAGVSGVERENYLAMIFMQKKDVVFKETSIAVIVEDKSEVNLSINCVTGGEKSTITSATADSSWFSGVAKNMLVGDLNDLELTEFTAIEADEEYLKYGQTLFQILKDNKFLNYFKDTAGDYAIGTLLQNVNTSNYVYVESDAQTPFNMIDVFTKYETP